MNEAVDSKPFDGYLADPISFFRDSQQRIGFVGPDIPLDVLLATRAAFGHLPWRTDGATPWADQWLESSFPFWARSILEQWHDGYFDVLDCVVFSRADDASQRLFYYVAELRRRGKLAGPAPEIFDISFIPRESGLAHTAAAITDLMSILAVNSDSLVNGIGRANRLRSQIAVIDGMRCADGPVFERMIRAALWSDPTAWIEEVSLNASGQRHPRVLLIGSTPPDDRIHQIVESAGASVIAELHALAPARPACEVGGNGESPSRSVARHLREHSLAPRAMFDRAGRAVAQAQAVAADAVLIWLTREDEGLAWTLPKQLRALEAAGIPALALPAARWQVDTDTAERITGFLNGVAI